MNKRTIVKKSVYYDSVKLMLVTREIKSMDGVFEIAVVMGTDLNKDALARTGLINDDAKAATQTDMIVGVICDTEETLNRVFENLDNLLNSSASQGNKAAYRPKSIETAVKFQPESNMCLISLPGAYAKNIAMEALRNNLHVMLFSDNVTMEEELELKTFAKKKDLLVMGPDCGTAIINGVPLCFANKISSGNIGVVAASGTGAQEVMTLIHKNGGGVTQVIGTGGRDLKEEIGGITMLQGLKALNEDKKTETIAIVSKPPSPKVVAKILEYIKENIKKPIVINFLGGADVSRTEGNIHYTCTLEETALKALELAKIIDKDYTVKADLETIAKSELPKIRKTGKFIRGLFSGGTLAYESVYVLKSLVGKINSNLTHESDFSDCFAMDANACVDLGADEYTVGRAHPMIDSTLRAEVFRKELRNPETAVILMDFVLGYGANMEPEKDFISELVRYKNENTDGNQATIIASLCGSEDDPQNFEDISKSLVDNGVIIMPSNLKATQLAAIIIKSLNDKEACK